MIGMMGGYGGFGWIGLIFNLLITVAVIIGLVFLVIWIVRRANSGGQFTTMIQRPIEPEASPKDLLQTRYARGEISREQYDLMKEDIR